MAVILLFADLISNVIYKWSRREGTTVFLEDAGYSGPDIYTAGTQTIRGRMHTLLIGPNGITLDREESRMVRIPRRPNHAIGEGRHPYDPR